MTTNPYAYYDDEPLPLNARFLSVSSDGEEVPDMEPRVPLELKGYFIAFFRPAVKTYTIIVERNSFECRLPGGEFLELSREEAAQRVSVHGNEIDIVSNPGYGSYCFRCKSQENLSLTLARLKVWLRPPISDPEEAYKAVAGELKKTIGRPFTWFAVFFLVWLVFMAYWGYPYWRFNQPGVLLLPALLYLGVCLLRFVCMIWLVAFLGFRLFGRVHTGWLRAGTLMMLVFPLFYWITLAVPGWRTDVFQHTNILFEAYFPVYFPLFFYGIYHRYRRSEKQLQRDNGQ